MYERESEKRRLLKGKSLGVRRRFVLSVIGDRKMRMSEVRKILKGKEKELECDLFYDGREYLFRMWRDGLLEREGVGEKLVKRIDVYREFELNRIRYVVRKMVRGEDYLDGSVLKKEVERFLEKDWSKDMGIERRYVRERWYRVSDLGKKFVGEVSDVELRLWFVKRMVNVSEKRWKDDIEDVKKWKERNDMKMVVYSEKMLSGSYERMLGWKKELECLKKEKEKIDLIRSMFWSMEGGV